MEAESRFRRHLFGERTGGVSRVRRRAPYRASSETARPGEGGPLPQLFQRMKRRHVVATSAEARPVHSRKVPLWRGTQLAATVLAFALALPTEIRAQASGRATITGVVTASSSGAPILGVTVSIPGTPFPGEHR